MTIIAPRMCWVPLQRAYLGDDYPSQPTRAHHGTTAKSFADVVHLFEQFDLFDGVFEEVDLVGAADEAGEFYTDEADELPSFEELVEEVEDVAGEHVVVGGIGIWRCLV